MKTWHWASIAVAVIVVIILLRYRVRIGNKAYLNKNLDNITHGTWRPKAGEYLGAVTNVNYSFDEVTIVPALFSSLEKNSFPAITLSTDTVEIKKGLVIEART
jgi:hypothetical protein